MGGLGSGAGSTPELMHTSETGQETRETLDTRDTRYTKDARDELLTDQSSANDVEGPIFVVRLSQWPFNSTENDTTDYDMIYTNIKLPINQLSRYPTCSIFFIEFKKLDISEVQNLSGRSETEFPARFSLERL